MRPGASCVPVEASMADDLRGVIDEMKLLRIAIGGVNPDPQDTIQAYRDRLAAQQRAADHLVTATEALVRTTSRLALANRLQASGLRLQEGLRSEVDKPVAAGA